jgi:hypothetical protein
MDVVEEDPVDIFFNKLCCFIKMIANQPSTIPSETRKMLNEKKDHLISMLKNMSDDQGLLTRSNGRTVLRFFKGNYYPSNANKNSKMDKIFNKMGKRRK